jgi:hypothetical protein
MTEHHRRGNNPVRGPIVRDLIMGGILLVWMMYAVASVIQLFGAGAKVLDSLPPFWFWGVPIAPYTALYQPWVKPGARVPGAPEEPEPPEAVA